MTVTLKTLRTSSGAFSNMIYGVGDSRMRDRDRDRLNDFASGLREQSRSFVDSTRRVMESLYSDATRALVHDAVSVLTNSSRDDIMTYLDDYRHIAMVAPRHRRFLAAHHRYRDFVRDGRCHAWGEARDTHSIQERKEDDIFYRAVRNGLVQEESETGKYYSEHEFGLGDAIESVTGYKPTLREQMDYANTWDVMDNLMDLGIDPSSANGELL